MFIGLYRPIWARLSFDVTHCWAVFTRRAESGYESKYGTRYSYEYLVQFVWLFGLTERWLMARWLVVRWPLCSWCHCARKVSLRSIAVFAISSMISPEDHTIQWFRILMARAAQQHQAWYRRCTKYYTTYLVWVLHDGKTVANQIKRRCS